MTDRRTIVEVFCEECVWARAVRNHFEALYERSERRRELLSEVANTFFGDLNIILIDYLLLQLCKLTDPAGSRPDRTNLTTNYILGLEWSSETREALACANAELLAFRSKIVDARRKLIAHLDVNARLASTGLGSFSEDDEVAFWSALQDFVNAAHSEAIGEPFEIDASMPAGDVENLVHSLKEAVDYSDIIEDDPRFLRTRAHAMRYKDA
jgi:hypothetical protein